MIKNGFIFPLIIFAPNLLFILFPPKEVPLQSEERGILKVMTSLERLGQASVLIIPFFYSIHILTSIQIVGFCVSIIVTALYYVGWLRYLLGGRHFSLLFAPMIGIPIPMAICPIVSFFASCMVLGSWPLFIGTLSLAVGHLYISYHTYLQINK